MLLVMTVKPGKKFGFQSAVENLQRRRRYGVMQVNPFVNLHLHNSDKQQIILIKFYTNNASFINNETAKFQLNLPK